MRTRDDRKFYVMAHYTTTLNKMEHILTNTMSRLLVSRFVVERIIERSPTSDVASSAAEALVAELAVHAVANVVGVKMHGSTGVD